MAKSSTSSAVPRALVLSPHTDDGEIGCGGTVAKLLGQGWEVFSCVLSMCEASVPAGLPPDTLEKEFNASMDILGIPATRRVAHNYPVRELPSHRQPILEHFVKLSAEIQPSLVFCPCSTDVHQDHHTVYAEAVRAFKRTTILGYEEPWNNIIFVNHALVPLEKEHIEKKVAALKAYQSQFGRKYFNEEYFRALAMTRGTQIEAPLAEAFEVVRWVMNGPWL